MGRQDARQKKGGEMKRGKKKQWRDKMRDKKKLGDKTRDEKNGETRHKTKKIERLDSR